MTPTVDLEQSRRRAILTSLAGFPFLLVFGFAWIAAALLTYMLPRGIAGWAYVCLGLPAIPLAIALERRVGYIRAIPNDPLLPLALQILFIQMVAFPAILLVWNLDADYLPVAFAAIVGAHFLPYQWMFRTSLYSVLSIIVSVGPFALVFAVGRDVLHYTGLLVGPALLIGAFLARAHARRTVGAVA